MLGANGVGGLYIVIGKTSSKNEVYIAIKYAVEEILQVEEQEDYSDLRFVSGHENICSMYIHH